MAQPKPRPEALDQTGQNLVRILIASYFLAVAIGLIPGTGISALSAQVLPDGPARIVGNGVLFSLSYLVLVGAWLRVSALLLATLVFWSSYVAHMGVNLEAYWRDMALVGALILTYTRTQPRAERRRGMLHWTPAARRIDATTPIRPRRVLAAHSRVQPARRIVLPAACARDVGPGNVGPLPTVTLRLVEAADCDNIFCDNIFLDDPDLAMAS